MLIGGRFRVYKWAWKVGRERGRRDRACNDLGFDKLGLGDLGVGSIVAEDVGDVIRRVVVLGFDRVSGQRGQAAQAR